MHAGRDSNPEADRTAVARYTRVGRTDQLAQRLVVAAAVVVALAILKPWAILAGPAAVPGLGAAATRPLDSAASGGAPSTRPALAAATPPGLDAEHIACFESPDWLLVTLERNGQDVTKSWYVVHPVSSLLGLPAPSTSPFRIVTGNLVGIGLCPPGVGRTAPEVRLAGAWVASRSGAPATPVVGLPVVSSPVLGTALLYGHPKQGVGEDASWPSGNFVFEAIDPRLNPYRVVWLGVTVVSAGNHRG